MKFVYPHQPKPRTRPIGAGGVLHVSIPKQLLIQQMREMGVNRVLGTSVPLSIDDGIAWVNGFPTTRLIPLDSACDDFDEEGGCNGHASAEVEAQELEIDLHVAATRGERGSQPNG